MPRLIGKDRRYSVKEWARATSRCGTCVAHSYVVARSPQLPAPKAKFVPYHPAASPPGPAKQHVELDLLHAISGQLVQRRGSPGKAPCPCPPRPALDRARWCRSGVSAGRERGPGTSFVSSRRRGGASVIEEAAPLSSYPHDHSAQSIIDMESLCNSRTLSSAHRSYKP